jgi:hypothetical protein
VIKINKIARIGYTTGDDFNLKAKKGVGNNNKPKSQPKSGDIHIYRNSLGRKKNFNPS